MLRRAQLIPQLRLTRDLSIVKLQDQVTKKSSESS
jgi:hypothetical protein